MGPSLPRSLQRFVHRAGCMHTHAFLAYVPAALQRAFKVQTSLQPANQQHQPNGLCMKNQSSAQPPAVLVDRWAISYSSFPRSHHLLAHPRSTIAEVHPCCFPPRASSTCRQDFGAEQLSQQLQRHFVSWIHLRVQRVEVKLWCQATAPWIHCYRAENWRPMLTALHRCTARS